MIKSEDIQKLINEKLEGTEMYLVDLTVSKSNKIIVGVDSFDGVTIDQCKTISRHIESNLDREEEDFELEVSSAGLDQPFKVIQQYEKNIGKDVEVVTTNGEKVKGVLISNDQENVVIEITKKIKPEGKKKKIEVKEPLVLSLNKIKTTKIIIKFK